MDNPITFRNVIGLSNLLENHFPRTEYISGAAQYSHYYSHYYMHFGPEMSFE